MSTVLNQDLKASGAAPCIVVLAQPARGGRRPSVERLSRHFVSSELTQQSALGSSAALSVRPPRDPVQFFPNLGVMFGTVDRAGAAALRAEAGVSAVRGAPQLSLIRPTRVASAALRRKTTWGLDSLGVEALWQQGFDGAGVTVGHLDTGVDADHPALREAVTAFAELDPFGRLVAGATAHDTGEHGTHTAATIAGRPVRGKAVGVAPGASLASAIVIEGGQVVARVLGGLDWAVGQQVRVVSMSLGLRGWWEDFAPIVRLLRDRDILPVFAVGNEGPGTSRSPGNYAEALSVGAHDPDRLVATFSSSQQFTRPRDPWVPDLAAPGVDVVSAKPGGGYQSMDGTSMATPHVAGLAAVLLQAVPDATADAVEAAIFGSCRPAGGPDADRANRGIPQAKQALELLRQNPRSAARAQRRRRVPG
jgi:subtilisin